MRTFILALALASATAAPRGIPSCHRGQEKIAGGTSTVPGEFPYMLSMQVNAGYYDDVSGDYDGWMHKCGAAIYDESTAITAADCLWDSTHDDPPFNYTFRIVAGEYNIQWDVVEPTEQKGYVSQMIFHEDYNPQTYANNIALLKFEPPLVFNDYVSSIALPETDDVFDNTLGTVMGWGWTEWSEGGYSLTLRKASVPIHNDGFCRINFSHNYNKTTEMCVGGGDTLMCPYDDGGPVVCPGDKLCGILSQLYCDMCKKPPSIATEVSQYVDWIRSNAY